MKRRKFLTAVGSMAAGGAAVMGTGAFTSANISRDVKVNVVRDNNAYVGLNPTDSRTWINNNTGELFLNLAGSNNGANGLNPGARTAFHDLFEITNQGDDTVLASVGVAKNQAYVHSAHGTWNASNFSNPIVNNANLGSQGDLLQDYSGIDTVYAFAEENGTATGMGNASVNKVDGGGRVWIPNTGAGYSGGQGELLGPGESVSIDLDIVTNNNYTPPEDTVSLLVLAVETNSDRDIKGSPHSSKDTF